MSTIKEKNKKWKSRRLVIASVAWGAITAFGIYCIEKGVGVEWFNNYTMATVLLALFGIGALTATDMMNRFKK